MPGDDWSPDFDVDADRVTVIPHGATMPSTGGDRICQPRDPGDRLRLLTWGLLGPGKGIEWAIDAMAMLERRPATSHLPRGRCDASEGARRDGEAYRRMLVMRSWRTGAARAVSFDDSYRDLPALTGLIGAADLVILPYDSEDQVTSGVLVDAVASGRPVIATAFPHAVELLVRRGRGRRPAARRGGDRRRRAQRRRIIRSTSTQMAAECRRLAPELSWPAVARRYDELAGSLLVAAGIST